MNSHIYFWSRFFSYKIPKEIFFCGIEYKVIKFFIDVSIDNKKEFTLISEYMKSNFGVWLLECPSELIPVWPPVVQHDHMIPVKNDSNVICLVSSGNDEPNVYSYSGNAVYRKEVKTISKGIHTIELSIGSYPTILSVDRKYVGREVAFIAKALQRSSYSYSFSYINSAGEENELTKISKNEVAKGFLLKSNSKFDIYLGNSEMVYKHFSVREQQTSITENQGITEISLIIGSNVYDCIKFANDIVLDTDINIFSQTIIASARGQLIPIPVWVNHILQYLRNHRYEQLYQAIVGTMVNDMLHIETVRQLRLLDLSIGISNNE